MGRQWHQPDHMQVICTSLQTDNHASTSPLKFLRARCPSCNPTNSVKALKVLVTQHNVNIILLRCHIHKQFSLADSTPKIQTKYNK